MFYHLHLIQSHKPHTFTNVSEPIGSRPPTFSIEAKSSTFQKATNTSFALLCQAQAWPVGVFK